MNSPLQREPSEWCKFWWSRADDSEIPRILLVGDSITVGYGPTVIERLQDIAAVDYLGTSRNITDPSLNREITYALGEYSYEIIHFNNGLHGWHLSDESYESGLRRMVQMFRVLAPSAHLIWASTTPVTTAGDPSLPHAEFSERVTRRNTRAAKTMEESGIPMDDLFAAVRERPDIRARDGFHYLEKGQTLLGNAVADFLCQANILTIKK